MFVMHSSKREEIMSKHLFLAVLAAAVLTGCSSNYVIHGEMIVTKPQQM